MTSLSRTGVLVSAWALILVVPSPAAAMLGDADEGVGLDGSFKTINAAVANYQLDGAQPAPNADGQSQGLLRLVLAGYPNDWLSYEIHALQSVSLLTRGVGNGAAATSTSSPGLRYRAFDGRARWHDEANVKATLSADRFNVRFSPSFGDITLGRQAITFGKAYFWNPLDVFLAFDPTSFDREYKRGVDAVRVDVPLGDFSGLTAVGVLGRFDGGHGVYRAAGLLRAFSNVADWDVAVQAGKIYGGLQGGAGASGELGPVELRLEAGYFWPLDELRPDNASDIPAGLAAVVGVGRIFSLFERTLVLQAEYLLNSAAGTVPYSEAFTLVAKGLMLQASEHVVGTMTSLQLTPLLNTSLAALVSLSSQRSFLLQPGFVFSVADEVELLAGGILAFGERPQLDADTGVNVRSEFGAYSHIFYIETKMFF